MTYFLSIQPSLILESQTHRPSIWHVVETSLPIIMTCLGCTWLYIPDTIVTELCWERLCTRNNHSFEMRKLQWIDEMTFSNALILIINAWYGRVLKNPCRTVEPFKWYFHVLNVFIQNYIARRRVQFQ